MANPLPYRDEKDDSSVEKGPESGEGAKNEGFDHVVADKKHQFDARDLDMVQRKLQQRHVQM
jgi:hypothetical protein